MKSVLAILCLILMLLAALPSESESYGLSHNMRKAEKALMAIKSRISAGDTQLVDIPYPTDFHLPAATENKEGDLGYTRMMIRYEMAWNQLAMYPDKNRGFNKLVSKCESCHKSYCAGPLRGIRKMYLDKK